MLSEQKLLAVFFCSLAFFACLLLHAQATGSFSGTVSDQTGLAVSGATVRVISQSTGISREARTDSSGHYLVPLLLVGEYTIRVDFQGFQTVEQKNIRLQVDEHRELDFTLVPALVSWTVEVSTTEVAVQTTMLPCITTPPAVAM